MAYVPEFKHDIFVSYAQVDDAELEPQIPSSRWVSMLLQRLEPRLKRNLHRDRVNDLSVFFDRRSIAPSAPLDDVILNALQSTAHLLIVLSERWLESPWCQQEIATVAQQPNIAGRISLVVLEDVPITRRPTALANLIGVSFGKSDPILKIPSVLGSPFHFQRSRDYQDYEDRLNQLVHDLASRLNQLRPETQPNAEASPVRTIGPNLPVVPSHQSLEPTPPSVPEMLDVTPLSGPRLNVLMADVEPSLAAARCSAIGSLFARGHEVFATPTSATVADK